MKQGLLHLIQRARLATKNQAAFTIVEILLAVAIFALLVTAFSGVYLYGQEASALAGNRTRATLVAQEGLEAVQNMRDADFANLVDGTYGLAISGGQWIFSGAQDVVNTLFTRSVTIATVDANRKSIVSTVNWQQNPQRTGSVVLTSRLTFWQKIVNLVNWANPNTLLSSLDMTGANDGLKIKISGNYAYVIRNGGVNFVVVDISNPALPTVTGSLTLVGTPSNLYVSGDYVYVASSDNNSELQIIDISNPSTPALAGVYNASGNGNGLGIYVVGTTAYLTRDTAGGNSFVIINVSNPALPTLTGSLSLNQVETSVVVSGNYAYVASGDNAQELKVINISNPALPVLAAGLNLSSNTNATRIDLNNSTVYLSQGATFYAINISTPTTPTILDSYAAGGTVNDIFLSATDNYAFLVAANGTNELQVLNISTPSAMTLLGGFNAAATPNGVFYDSVSAKAYLVGPTNTQELYVIQP